MSTEHDLQARVGEWAHATFPGATDATITAHLADEVRELQEARGEAVRGEAADVFLILLHYCWRHGIDLQAEAERKFAACRERRWEFDPVMGYVRHVEESAPDQSPGVRTGGGE